jgi:hypothetical protein
MTHDDRDSVMITRSRHPRVAGLTHAAALLFQQAADKIGEAR